MRILVTGGGGFLGQNLVRALRARGDEVCIFARGHYPELGALGVQEFVGDIRDGAAILKAMVNVDSVFHIAAKVGYWGSAEGFAAINVGGTQRVIEGCLRAGVRRLIYTSSASVVMGIKGGILNGDERLAYPSRHLCDYSATKAQGEALVLAAQGREGLSTCSIRPHFIIGPGDTQVFPRLIEKARRGQLIRIGDGLNQVDVTYIDNVVSAHILAHEALKRSDSPVGGQAYFVGQERPVNLWDFIAEVVQGYGLPPVTRHMAYAPACILGAGVEAVWRFLRISNEPPLTRSMVTTLGTSHYFSHAKARRDFGYEVKVSLADGMRRSVRDVATAALQS